MYLLLFIDLVLDLQILEKKTIFYTIQTIRYTLGTKKRKSIQKSNVFITNHTKALQIDNEC